MKAEAPWKFHCRAGTPLNFFFALLATSDDTREEIEAAKIERLK
jgi:hypothetical protein